MRGANNEAAKRIVDSLKSIPTYTIRWVVIDGEERGKHFVAGDGEGLGKKISEVFETGDKEDSELALIDTIT